MTAQEKLVKTALSQVGYAAASGKKTKYASELDKIGYIYNGPKNGFDWCDVFVDWCFIKTFGTETGIKMIYQPKNGTGAGCPFSANFYKNNKAFYSSPKIGDQIFFGERGNEYHTGIVVDIGSNIVYTVEGNTGGGNGKVMKKAYSLKSGVISGYGRPNWSLAESKPSAEKNKTVAAVAKEVVAGKWSNGAERKKRLTEAGYDYDKVQAEVNKILSKKKSNEEVAKEVVAGKWGNGAARKKKITEAGYDYDAVQAIVNKLLK